MQDNIQWTRIDYRLIILIIGTGVDIIIDIALSLIGPTGTQL